MFILNGNSPGRPNIILKNLGFHGYKPYETKGHGAMGMKLNDKVELKWDLWKEKWAIRVGVARLKILISYMGWLKTVCWIWISFTQQMLMEHLLYDNYCSMFWEYSRKTRISALLALTFWNEFWKSVT